MVLGWINSTCIFLFNAQEEEADELRARNSNCVSKKQFSLSGEPAGLGLSEGYGGVRSYLVPAATGPAALQLLLLLVLSQAEVLE